MVHAELFFYDDFIEVDTEIRFQILEILNMPDTRESSPFTNVKIVDPT